ncbi:hypothetical protein AB9F45_39135, partial [Rhizobium leguminosarum]
VYIVSAIGIFFVTSFAGLLVRRFVQGIGSAATRVITISIFRDIYGGRQMAEEHDDLAGAGRNDRHDHEDHHDQR